MEPADPLDRGDLSRFERLLTKSDRVAGDRIARVVRKPKPRPAVVAAHGLRVIAASRNIKKLRRAFIAHREACHRGLFSVVGDAADDRKARPAVGAVDERVAIAAVLLVEQLAHAGVARRRVGRDRRFDRLARGALFDDKIALPRRHEFRALDALDQRQRRRFGCERGAKFFDRPRAALQFDRHAARGVADEAAEGISPGKPIDERPKPDALHRAEHEKPHAQNIAHCAFCSVASAGFCGAGFAAGRTGGFLTNVPVTRKSSGAEPTML